MLPKILRRNLKSVMQVLHSLQDFPLRNPITELILQSDRGKKLGEKRPSPKLREISRCNLKWVMMQELYSLCVNV